MAPPLLHALRRFAFGFADTVVTLPILRWTWRGLADDAFAGDLPEFRPADRDAVRCLDASGVLVYCVCSLEPAEGEEQVDWALGALPGLELWSVTPAELPGLEQAVTARGLVRTHPGMAPGGREGGMDGFFVARFRRR